MRQDRDGGETARRKALPPELIEKLREVARTLRTPDDVKATVRAALTSSHL